MFPSLRVRRGREGLEVVPQLRQLKTAQGGVMALLRRAPPRARRHQVHAL
jgi:hypothetical protein